MDSKVASFKGLGSGIKTIGVVALSVVALAGCSTTVTEVPEAQRQLEQNVDYVIGPGDSMEIFVWGNQELSIGGVQVRPDGKITTRLVENIEASGKTPSELARHIEEAYATYVKHPVVSVIVGGFVGVPDQQIRVVGEASQPLSIPFRKHMTILDVMIASGGLTEFAAGNKAVLIRNGESGKETYSLRLEDLLEDGDITANLTMMPGDIVMIPESWF